MIHDLVIIIQSIKFKFYPKIFLCISVETKIMEIELDFSVCENAMLKFRSRNESIFIAGKLLENERNGKCIYVFIAKYQIRHLISCRLKSANRSHFFFRNLLSDFLKQTCRVCFVQIDARGRIAQC